VLLRGLESLRRQGKAESWDALAHLKALTTYLKGMGRNEEAARYASEADALASQVAARKRGKRS